MPMQYFLFARDRRTGEIVHREILHEGADLPEFSDPFWLAAGARQRAVEAQFPEAQVVRASASSIDAFLANHPEFGPVVGP